MPDRLGTEVPHIRIKSFTPGGAEDNLTERDITFPSVFEQKMYPVIRVDRLDDLRGFRQEYNT